MIFVDPPCESAPALFVVVRVNVVVVAGFFFVVIVIVDSSLLALRQKDRPLRERTDCGCGSDDNGVGRHYPSHTHIQGDGRQSSKGCRGGRGEALRPKAARRRGEAARTEASPT